jgi:hypothetical protein
MSLSYQEKEAIMQEMFKMHKTPSGFRSTWKNCPIYNYEFIKRFIDFTKYYVVFRGPRMRGASSTRKRDARAFDVYQRSQRDTERLRIESEAFYRGVQWSENNG